MSLGRNSLGNEGILNMPYPNAIQDYNDLLMHSFQPCARTMNRGWTCDAYNLQ